MHQRGGLALGAQAVQHAQHPAGLARQHRLAQLEDVVARHVQHRRLHLRQAQLTRREQQCQFLQLLVGGQQIALHPVGKEGQGVLAGLALGHALALGGQALGDPGWQRAALHRVNLEHHAGAVQRAKPGALLLLAIEFGQMHDGQHLVAELLAVALQGL